MMITEFNDELPFTETECLLFFYILDTILLFDLFCKSALTRSVLLKALYK